MTRKLLLFCLLIIFGSCKHQTKQETNNYDLESDTVAIYLSPIEYDTLLKSVRDHIEYEGKDSLGYIPKGSDVTLTFSYRGKLKEYMKHGTMNVVPYDSTVIIRKLSDTSFVFQVTDKDNNNNGVVSMMYEPVLEAPYYFTTKRDGRSDVTRYGKPIPLFLRSFITGE